jgi:pimeloyl-ACP methyl ester carboxylesterase
VQVDERRIAWIRAGDGPPLVLLNGYAATGSDWDPNFVAALAARRQVVCIDPRGFGASSLGTTAGYSIDALAHDVLPVLDACGFEAVPIVGWSMGGFVAQTVARHAPDRVAALVLMATDAGGPGAVRAAPEVWARLVDHTGTPAEQARRLLSLLFPSDVSAALDESVVAIVADARARLSATALTAEERAMDDWYAHAPRSTPPVATLVLHGESDVVIPAANAEIVKTVWNAAVRRYDGLGHALMAQQPTGVAAAIGEWLTNVDAPPPPST